jgi:hypothetical protein
MCKLVCTGVLQVSQLVEQQGGLMSGMDVPALLHMYKARLAIACCNYKAAKKEVRTHIGSANQLHTIPTCREETSYAMVSARVCCTFAHACVVVCTLSLTPLPCTLIMSRTAFGCVPTLLFAGSSAAAAAAQQRSGCAAEVAAGGAAAATQEGAQGTGATAGYHQRMHT